MYMYMLYVQGTLPIVMYSSSIQLESILPYTHTFSLSLSPSIFSQLRDVYAPTDLPTYVPTYL